MKKRRSNNPVLTMDSVDALDLISESLRLLRGVAHPAFVARLREQKQRHARALKRVIGTEDL